jgi:3',5'-cyclic AMP phosphodiesterase CpdA
MNRYILRLVVLLNLTLIISKCPGVIDVDHYSIGGTGPEYFRFVILSDLQVGTGGSDIDKLAEAVDKVIELNNDTDSSNDVEFVVILGDLIQGGESKGELEYRQEYEQVLAELERLEVDCPIGAGIPYIPVIGNHDVWFQLPDYTVEDDFPDYPEELFTYYFTPQYGELSTCFANWTKQEIMPSTNPYRPDFPAPHFQNFAFDYGPYHFIFSDFSDRDDFDPIASGLIPRLKKFTGYADLHDVANGTWQWLTTHLEECRMLGVHNVIIFSHHPPLYQLGVTRLPLCCCVVS